MSGSTLYDSPSLYNIEPPAHIGNRRPKSLKQQLLKNNEKNNKENECMKCRVSFEVKENAFRSRRKRTHTPHTTASRSDGETVKIVERRIIDDTERKRNGKRM